MEIHTAALEKIYEDATHASQSKEKSFVPYLKLLAHVQQQVREREGTLADLQLRLEQAGQREACAVTAETAARALVQERDAALREQLLRVSELEKRINELDVEARHYRESLEAILSSTFWKLTTPIRWLRHPTRAPLDRDR